MFSPNNLCAYSVESPCGGLPGVGNDSVGYPGLTYGLWGTTP